MYVESVGTDRSVCTTKKMKNEISNMPISVTKRNLPHWTREGATYWVTFRLADSLPFSKLATWKTERNTWMACHPEPWDEQEWQEYSTLFSNRLEQWLDAGMGECHMRNPAIRDLVQKSLTHFKGERYRLPAWVIMPNHVHALIHPMNDHSLSSILKGIKGVSARRCNKVLQRTGQSFWQEESYDHIVRSEAQFAYFVRYIMENPSKAKLPHDAYSIFVEE
jgi:REP element-mobilizing transposase RayT